MFGVGVGCIVNDDIRPFDQPEDGFVGIPHHMLGVGDVADRFAEIVDPVAGRTAWMIERRRADLDALLGRQGLAAAEIVERDRGMHDVERYWKECRLHQIAKHALEAARTVAQMTAVKIDLVAFAISRLKERNAVNVVEMGVEKNSEALTAWQRAARSMPRPRRPVPASKMSVWSPQLISTQAVLPP